MPKIVDNSSGVENSLIPAFTPLVIKLLRGNAEMQKSLPHPANIATVALTDLVVDYLQYKWTVWRGESTVILLKERSFQ